MPSQKDFLKEALWKLQEEGLSYLEDCKKIIGEENESSWVHIDVDYWSQLTPELNVHAEKLITEFIAIGQKMTILCKNSALVDDADLAEIPVLIKTIRATLALRQYQYSDPDVLHDEGMVLGFKPARQYEAGGLDPSTAIRKLNDSCKHLLKIIQLVDADVNVKEAHSQGSATAPVNKYKANTAFIMMWMDNNNPELMDVHDAVKETFAKFDIHAVRADDIEHEGIITQRIIDEIRASEFLFADLTGARPNVYYETGYAHALGKRVILFRKMGTGLHFDLAGYNCPEYNNLRDLKEKLQRRLISLTNRNPNK